MNKDYEAQQAKTIFGEWVATEQGWVGPLKSRGERGCYREGESGASTEQRWAGGYRAGVSSPQYRAGVSGWLQSMGEWGL
jgi:hypothetical protein